MKTPKVEEPTETEAQKEARLRAEKDNLNAVQETVQQRTSLFRRRVSPRVSLVNGTVSTSASML